MITKGAPENVVKGPLLDSVPFPDVLVSKAYSQDGESLDLVLYPGKEGGKFKLGFNRLIPGEAYTVDGAGVQVQAEKDGSANVEVQIDGRTALKLVMGAS